MTPNPDLVAETDPSVTVLEEKISNTDPVFISQTDENDPSATVLEEKSQSLTLL